MVAERGTGTAARGGRNMAPDRADVVVVGGGVVGSSVALHLREADAALRVIVVERDPTYATASSRLATGGIRQQYESPLNVAMARYSVAFLAGMDARLAAVGHAGRVRFRQRGYLFLADDACRDAMERRYGALCRSGARVDRWTREMIEARVPGLACDDVGFAIFGPEDGYLEPREVLAGMRALAAAAGAEFRDGNVTGIDRAGGRVEGVVLDAVDDGPRRIAAPVVVNAAGAFAAAVGAAAGIALPIRPVRQHLFRLTLGTPLPSRIPMIVDPDGTHWRLDDAPGLATERLVIGRSRTDEPPGENLECDRTRLHEAMLPTLRRRYPAAAVTGVAEAWAGLYEMSPDHNGLLGEHPALSGFIVAAGFSGHGLMLSPATGRAVAELVTQGRSESVDIGPLAPDRFDRGVPFHDAAIL